MEKQISEMLSIENKSCLTNAMLNLLRVLVVDKGAVWKSELVQDLQLLQEFRGQAGPVDEKELNKVLKELQKLGFVKVEKHVKGALDAKNGIRDELISLAKPRLTNIALSKDKILTSYMYGQKVK